jgi:serpin B
MESWCRGEVFPIADGGVEKINAWVSKQTEGMIPNLLSPGDLPDNMTAVLLNAMHFTAKWEQEFGEPFDDLFTFANGETNQTKMIQTTGDFYTFRGEGFTMVEIPYKSEEEQELVHLIFLPDRAEDLPQLEKRLCPEFILGCLGCAQKERVRLKMPKMDIRYRNDQLLPLLKEMGIPLDGTLPELGNSVIDKIVHEARLIVDEKGSKGAAATAVITARCTAHDKPVSINVDHDFAYFVMERGQFLFEGNVKDKSAF